MSMFPKTDEQFKDFIAHFGDSEKSDQFKIAAALASAQKADSDGGEGLFFTYMAQFQVYKVCKTLGINPTVFFNQWRKEANNVEQFAQEHKKEIATLSAEMYKQ